MCRLPFSCAPTRSLRDRRKVVLSWWCLWWFFLNSVNVHSSLEDDLAHEIRSWKLQWHCRHNLMGCVCKSSQSLYTSVLPKAGAEFLIIPLLRSFCWSAGLNFPLPSVFLIALTKCTNLLNRGELLPLFVFSEFLPHHHIISFEMGDWSSFSYKRCSISANLIILISLCCHGWNAVSAQYCASFLFCDAEKNCP